MAPWLNCNVLCKTFGFCTIIFIVHFCIDNQLISVLFSYTSCTGVRFLSEL